MLKILFSLLFLSACGTDKIDCIFKGEKCHTKKPSPTSSVTEEQKEALREMRASVRTWALKCEGGIACGETDERVPDAGDSMLWGGLLCASGEQDQCEAVKASQNSDGQIFRNPGLSRGKNDSSRDMLLGYLHYLSATKDTDGAKALLNYIVKNDYKLCTNATDNRCSVNKVINAAIWGSMRRVWQHIGLTPTSDMEDSKLTDESIVAFQSKFSAEGYELHLVAVELLLRQVTRSYSNTLANAAQRLAERQPNNPYFEFVANGQTEKAARLTLEKCPSTLDHIRKQWSWQREEDEKAWLVSKGWECIYIANLLLK